jgi:hypothetical protein
MAEKPNVSVELDAELVEVLAEAAKEHETTVSEIANQLITFAIAQLEAAADAGIEFEAEDDCEDDCDDDCDDEE